MDTQANTQTSILDLNAMMETTLDTIPDAPDYSNPPAGEYRIGVKEAKVDSYQNKSGEDMQRLKITYFIVETKNTAANEAPVPDGTMFTETFQATEMGLSFFKARVKAIMNVSDLVGVSLGDMMGSIKGTEFDCRISIKKSPKPGSTTEFYENLQIKVVPPAA